MLRASMHRHVSKCFSILLGCGLGFGEPGKAPQTRKGPGEPKMPEAAQGTRPGGGRGLPHSMDLSIIATNRKGNDDTALVSL